MVDQFQHTGLVQIVSHECFHHFFYVFTHFRDSFICRGICNNHQNGLKTKDNLTDLGLTMETNRFDYFGRSKIMEFGFHMWVKPVARMLAEFPEKQKEYGLDTHNNGAVNHFHSKWNGTTHKQRKEKRYLPRSGSSLEYLLSRMKTFSISKVFKLAIFRTPD